MSYIKTPPEWHIIKQYAKYIYRVLGYRIIKIYLHSCTRVFIILKEYIQDFFFFFTKHSILGYSSLYDIALKDIPGFVNRFFITYILLIKSINIQVQVSCFVKESESIKSISNLYLSSKWLESEVWEFFGVYFLNIGGMLKCRRILTDYGFTGYPLRKDFPVTGFLEILYSTTYGLFESKLQGKTLFLETRIQQPLSLYFEV